MQEVVYKCDFCKEIIGKKKHISVSFGAYSGIALPPEVEPILSVPLNKRDRWAVSENLQGKFMHFCNGKCIGGFFRELLKK